MANRPLDTTTVSPLSIAASVMWAAPRLAGAGGVGLASGTAILTGLAAEGTSVGAGSGAALATSTGFAGAGGATGLAGLSAATVATAIGAAGAVTASPSGWIGSISLAVGVGMTIATCCVASGFGLLLASNRLGVSPGAGPSAAKPRSSRTIISLSRDPALRPPRMTAMIRWPLRTAELARL